MPSVRGLPGLPERRGDDLEDGPDRVMHAAESWRTRGESVNAPAARNGVDGWN